VVLLFVWGRAVSLTRLCVVPLASQYLHEHGLKAFFEWYDYMSWYPLGRPVGTTIYPGMQMTSVAIWHVLQRVGLGMSLNDVCCYVPAWFGVSASLLTGLLTFECSGSRNAGVFAALMMSCIPAHIMRSVGGGYDNESIAVTAMTLTFYLWCRALRSEGSALPLGVLAGLAQVYMAAAWGGYVFVINMVGLHAISLVFAGRYTSKLFWAYCSFYAVGTLGAIQVPVVGLTPLKSLEQIGPLGVFGVLFVLKAVDVWCAARGVKDADEVFKVRLQAFSVAAAGAAGVATLLYPTGYFGPLSSRVRGLFVQHTRTGNPLVDSVAEHQPASSNAYYQYLHFACYLAPIGYLRSWVGLHDSQFFIPLYASIAYAFSSKMVRLIILLGPIASACSGIALAMMIEWANDQVPWNHEAAEPAAAPAAGTGSAAAAGAGAAPAAGTTTPGKKKEEQAKAGKRPANAAVPQEFDDMAEQWRVFYAANATPRKVVALLMCYMLALKGVEFYNYCQHMARAMSNPSIMYNAQLRDGTKVLVDDYRQAYFWLRDNTPADARIMAWWDYGYQITGIANRTTIADGNTWNHEHIATLGRCLVSEEVQAHRMIRHLADYVLVWSGGGGDDLAKMPHIARIANSVYKEVCNGDPLCQQLWIDKQGNPSPFMENSLLYKLHSGNQKAGVTLDAARFSNVFNSRFNKVRIWKVEKVDEDSKAWVKDPKHRVCNPPGSWLCRGQYPPAFLKFMEGRQDFAQLEDFNSANAKSAEAEEYQRKYHASMAGRQAGGQEGH
jgi:dolichyl-diphosphooligosaccharide--protein glycosyltransferase